MKGQQPSIHFPYVHDLQSHDRILNLHSWEHVAEKLKEEHDDPQSDHENLAESNSNLMIEIEKIMKEKDDLARQLAERTFILFLCMTKYSWEPMINDDVVEGLKAALAEAQREIGTLKSEKTETPRLPETPNPNARVIPVLKAMQDKFRSNKNILIHYWWSKIMHLRNLLRFAGTEMFLT